MLCGHVNDLLSFRIRLVKMNLINLKVFNVIVLVSSCFGGTVKRDTSTQNEIPPSSDLYDIYDPYYAHNHHSHLNHHHHHPPPHPREALCGSLQNLLQILYNSGVTRCQQLPKDFQGKNVNQNVMLAILNFDFKVLLFIASIRNFCLHSGTQIIGDCLTEAANTVKCINNATKVRFNS